MKNEDICRKCNTNGINDKSHTISHKDLSPDLSKWKYNIKISIKDMGVMLQNGFT
jgi:hypothetical protein